MGYTKEYIDLQIEEIYKAIDELRGEIRESNTLDTPNICTKSWPNTLEEALSESPFWGFECDTVGGTKRYYIVPFGQERGSAVSLSSCWCDKMQMQKYWMGSGIIDLKPKYFLEKFSSRKDLYTWLLAGEDLDK